MEFALRRDRLRRRASFTGRADLHVHSLYSDGGQAPEAIVRDAAGRLDVVAITDPDEVGGALRARDFAREHPELGVDVVVGHRPGRYKWGSHIGTTDWTFSGASVR